MSMERVGLYLQDAHSLPDGIRYAQYAEARGFVCVEVDLAVLRGEREPDLKLFAA